MSFKKFGQNDIILNTMVAYPHCEFFIHDGDIFYNSTPTHAGTARAVNLGPGDPKGSGPNPASPYSAVAEANMVSLGSINLYEYNVDRPNTSNAATSPAIGLFTSLLWADGTTTASTPSSSARDMSGLPSGGYGPENYQDAVDALKTPGDPVTFVEDTGRIYPWISKDSAGATWKTISATAYATEYQYGSIVVGSYPLYGSIKREKIDGQDPTAPLTTGPSASLNAHYYSLKNRLNFYGVRNAHYKVSGSIGTQSWNKNIQTLNTLAIPSIFFGSRIKPGTVSLKYFYTGSLVAELQDIRQNGELVQVSGSSTAVTHNNKTAGVIMYDEGYIILTGSWSLNDEFAAPRDSWLSWSAGAGDSPYWLADEWSFGLSFKGHTETQVMTLFTHAKRGEANFSNNPTYLKYGQDKLKVTSSQVYEENSQQLLANTVSSSYTDYDADFKRSVYISRVAVYDENKNIIGIATLANPVLKEEDQDYSIKLKLDI